MLYITTIDVHVLNKHLKTHGRTAAVRDQVQQQYNAVMLVSAPFLPTQSNCMHTSSYKKLHQEIRCAWCQQQA